MFEWVCDSFIAEVQQTEGFTLWWTDGVANEWEETYPTPAQAVVRLGLLIAAADEENECLGASRGPRFFSHDASRFARSCEGLGDALDMFIDSQLED
jgi:hypothetical protein